MALVMSPEVRRSLMALLPCAFVYLYVFPYFPEINNPNENVRFYMTAALVEEGRYEIDTMRERWGWTNDAACVERDPEHGLKPCAGGTARGAIRNYYSVKSPGTSFLGVPGYATYLWLSGKSFDRTTALRIVRITASIVPALVFLFFFHLWMRSQVESAFIRNTTFFSMAIGSAFCAYTLLFTSHTQSAICGFGAFMILERAQRLGRIGAFGAGLAGFLAAGATAFEYPCVVASLALCVFALVAIKSRGHLIAFAAGALIPTLAVMHFQWQAFGSPLRPGHLFMETRDFRLAYERGFFGAVGFQLEAAWRLLFDLRMGLFSMTPIFVAAPIGWWVLFKNRERRFLAWVSLAACGLLYILICCMNNWSGGWVVGPRYLVLAIPFCSWAAAHGLAWMLERWSSATVTLGLAATGASFVAGGLPSTYYPHLPEVFDFPLKHLFVELLLNDYAPMNLGHSLRLHGTLSMIPVFVTWLLVVVCLYRLRGVQSRWTAIASVLTALLLLSPQALAPKKSPKVEEMTRHLLKHWEPLGYDRASQLAKTEGRRPNVLLISLDTLRADHLPMYGYKFNTAPNLVAFAKESVVFEQAFAAHTNTAPSHATMLTGLYPTKHGIERNGMHLADGVQTLGQLLHAYGYQTAAVVSGWTLRKHTGLDRGFDQYVDHTLESRERKAPETYELARKWLTEAAKDGRPFFLMVHMFDPHYLYEPPLEDAERFLPSGLHPTHRGYPGVPGYGWSSLSRESRTKLVARYDGEIYFADSQIGRLLDDLKSAGLDDDTLVVFLSDHGETLEEREWGFDHGAQAYDEQIHVPLIIRFPDRLHQGKRVPGQVHHVDVFPTVLETLNLPIPEAASGRSLLPLVEGNGRWPAPRAVFSHARPEKRRYRRLHAKTKLTNAGLVASLRLSHVKLIEYPTEDGSYYRELFLLESDPGETNNVADRHRKLTSSLHTELEQWRASVGGAGPPRVVDIPAEVQEGLRALGYME